MVTGLRGGHGLNVLTAAVEDQRPGSGRVQILHRSKPERHVLDHLLPQPTVTILLVQVHCTRRETI